MSNHNNTDNLIQPTFHYCSGIVHLQEGDDGVSVSELVLPGQPLASFGEEKRKRAPLEAGENCRWQEESIVAEIAGYPRCVPRKTGSGTAIVDTIEVEPLLLIAIAVIGLMVFADLLISAGNFVYIHTAEVRRAAVVDQPK